MEKEKHVWLNSLFFHNTIQVLQLWNNKSLSEYIFLNYEEKINFYFKSLYQLIDSRVEEDLDHINENEKFLTLMYKMMDSCWASDIEKCLHDLIEFLKNNESVKISEATLVRLKTYQNSLIIKTRFGIDSIKKYRNYFSSRKSWGNEQTKIFINKALIPYFENTTKDSNALSRYIEWLQTTDNFFRVLNGDVVFQSSKEQHEKLYLPIKAYIYKHNTEYDRDDFITLITTLFSTLESISLNAIVVRTYDLTLVKNDLDLFYTQTIRSVNVIIYFDLAKKISHLIEEAVNDAVTAYSNIRATYNWSWVECQSHTGFQAQILYYLYHRFYYHDEIIDNELRTLATDLANYAMKKYRTYIDPTAKISNTAYIKNNCMISKNVVIKENVFLNNCRIEKNAIINENVLIDTVDVQIESGTVIEKNTQLTGNISVTMKVCP